MKATIFSNKNRGWTGLRTLWELETFSIPTTITRGIDGQQILALTNSQKQIDIIILDGISLRKLIAEIGLAVGVRVKVGAVAERIVGQTEATAQNRKKDLFQGSAKNKASTKGTTLLWLNDWAMDIQNRPKRMKIGTLTCNRRNEGTRRIRSMRVLLVDVAPSDKREAYC